MNFFYLKRLSLLFFAFYFTGSYAVIDFRNMVESPKSAANILYFNNIKRDHNLKPEFIKFLKYVFGATIFVETGTLAGGTAYNASLSMDEVHTIELSEDLYNQVVKRFENASNVTPYCGDSSYVLPKILKNNGNKYIFWLDGHYSEGVTAKGDVNTPILAELDAIKNVGLTDSIILIDDIRCFQKMSKDPRGTALEGYPEIQVILEAVLKIDPAYKCALLGDILMCYIPQDNFSISSVVHACTLSRILSEKMQSKMDLVFTENTIKCAQGKEKKFLDFLFKHYQNEYISQTYGLNRYFNLWHDILNK
jgi:hypothetical protein